MWGVKTAGHLVLFGLEVTLPAPGTTPEAKDEWIVVMGGSGSVGQYVSRIARIAGYNVLASSSKAKAEVSSVRASMSTIYVLTNPARPLLGC
jgi:NADPH:quinone reductase-like Zn-dependent oxidoreductase